MKRRAMVEQANPLTGQSKDFDLVKLEFLIDGNALNLPVNVGNLLIAVTPQNRSRSFLNTYVQDFSAVLNHDPQL